MLTPSPLLLDTSPRRSSASCSRRWAGVAEVERGGTALSRGVGAIGRQACPAQRGTISQMTSRPATAQHLLDLARLRRVRDRIDREYAQPLDVEALARG